jgi:thiaminase (transcriptional activator TenA)
MASLYEPIPPVGTAEPAGRASPSQLLERIGRPEVERWTGHPFVRGLADGSLPIEAFRWYLQQDWLYLKNYVRVYARLAGRAPDDAVEHLVGLAHDLARTELGLIRELMAPYGVRFEGVEATPVNARYQAFLLEAADADFATGVAATMPCLWGYSVMSRSFAEPPDDGSHPYAAWLRTYRADAMWDSTMRLLGLLDDTAGDLAAVEGAFRTAFAYEWSFWDNPHLRPERDAG